MKTTNTIFNKILFLLVAFISVAVWSELQAQVEIPFTQRPNTIFNIKGDFQMIGNSNMQRRDGGTGDNGNTIMNYVDIDGIGTTVNSSMAKLTLPTGKDAIGNPTFEKSECSNIIYAGLYWVGRAHDGGNSPHTFQVTKTGVPGAGTPTPVNQNYTVSHNDGITNYTNYTMTVSREGTNNNYYVRYTFSSSVSGQPTVIFEFLNNTPYIRYSTDNGATWTNPTNQTFSDGAYDNLRTATFDPVTVYSESGGITLTVNQLVRDRRQNRQLSSYQFSARASGNVSGTYTPPGTVTKTLDKSVVYLKHQNATEYTAISAVDENFTKNIYYPSSAYGNMYAGYADVTNYVIEHGLGEYTVADIALIEGNGYATGFFGGWGMIVVYENSIMPWRDVTIFDGYAYVIGGSAAHTLGVSGFRTAQNGDIRVKLGLIAGEGDSSITGDFFSIRNAANTDWVRLSHKGNNTGNFFQSSIPGANPRNPNRTNNTGVDIAEFELNNTGNNLITNNQDTTTFRYGSTQDTYIIPAIAMAVDAYIPDVEAVISISKVNGGAYGGGQVLPGDEIEYQIELKNPGNEDILNANITIPIPYTANYVNLSASATYHPSLTTGSQPVYNADGKYIYWNIGTIPHGVTDNPVLATMTFKLTATQDCFLLANEDCTPTVLIEGSINGEGAISQTPLSNLRFIRGYKDDIIGCENEPIYGPLAIEIDAIDWVENNCTEEQIAEKVFTFCYNENEDKIQFSQIASKFPPNTRFYDNVVEELIDSVIVVKPAENANEFTETTGFPNTPGTTNTYFALPSGLASCWWEFDITVEVCNLWMGNISEDWATSGNWTNNIVPNGASENVIFATAQNYGQDAQRDLVLDQNRIIGNVTNESPKALRIPVEKTLIINGEANFGTGTTAADKLVIESELGKGNGALIFGDPSKNPNVLATVEYDSKSEKVTEGNYPRRWQYIGTPVKNAKPIDVFGPNVTGSKYGPANHVLIRKYDESKNDPSDIGDKWINVDINAEMTGFAGYEVVQPAQGTGVYNFKGALYVGDFTTGHLGFTNSAYYRGNYIIANSYVAPIYISKLLAADFENLEQGVYLYNTGSRDQWLGLDPYGAANNSGNAGSFYSIPVNSAPTLAVNQIPSLNGFMVRRLTNAAGYDANNDIKFNFNYARLVKDLTEIGNNPTQPMKAKAADGISDNKYPLLKVDVITSNGVDRAMLLTVPNTTKGFDNGWDGYKLRTQTDAQIYSFVNGTDRFQVSSDCNLDGTILGFYNGTNETNFTLKFHFQDMEGIYDHLTITDLETGVTSDIKDGATISFAASKNSPEARFKINGKITPTKKDDLESPISIVYNKSQNLDVTNNGNETGTVAIYDVAGGLIYESAMPKGYSSYKINLPKGVFIIEAKTAGYRNQVKVIAQ